MMDDPEQASGTREPRSPGSGAFSFAIDDAVHDAIQTPVAADPDSFTAALLGDQPDAKSDVVASVEAQRSGPQPEPAEQAAPSGRFDRWTFLAAWVLIGLGLILVLWAVIGNS